MHPREQQEQLQHVDVGCRRRPPWRRRRRRRERRLPYGCVLTLESACRTAAADRLRETAVAYVLGLVHAWRRHSHVGGSEIVRAPGPCAARTEAPRGATACRPARQLGLGGRGQAAQADREDRRRKQRTQHLGFEIWGLGAPFHGDREALGLAVAAGKEDPGARINVVVEGAVRGDFVGEGGGEVGAGGGVGGVLREELDNLSMSVALSGGTALGGEFELMKRGWRISTVLRQRMGPNQN